MAELSKYFHSIEEYEEWKNNKDIPSYVFAIVLNADGDSVDMVAFSTNDITGEFDTYEVTKGEEKKYATNDNVYVNTANDTTLQYLMKENLYEEFDYPEKEGDIFATPFEFYLVSINYPVDIENVKIYFGDRNSTPSGIQWINIQENAFPIQYTLLDNGNYRCSVMFRDDVEYNQNFFISYTLPSSSSTQYVDDYIIGYWKSGGSSLMMNVNNEEDEQA